MPLLGVRCIAYGDGKFVVAGLSEYYATSIDGENWDSGYKSSYHSPRIAYGNGVFVAVGGDGISISYISTFAGGNWTTKQGHKYWTSVTYSNGRFILVGTLGYATTSTDGATWTTPVLLKDELGNDTTLLFVNDVCAMP